MSNLILGGGGSYYSPREVSEEQFVVGQLEI